MNVIVVVLIAITCIISFIGFNNPIFFDRYKFNIYGILNLKQVDRLLSSGFLHADFMHLLFNMFTLYFFSDIIISKLGALTYIILYLIAILGGNLLSLWVFRRDSIYSAIGASGGVSGILFASIAIYPNLGLYILPIPFEIPGWVFGIVYLGFSVYGMKRSLGNIGHSAHLGGAIIGLASTIILSPQVLVDNGLYIGIMLIPLIILAYMVFKGE